MQTKMRVRGREQKTKVQELCTVQEAQMHCNRVDNCLPPNAWSLKRLAVRLIRNREITSTRPRLQRIEAVNRYVRPRHPDTADLLMKLAGY